MQVKVTNEVEVLPKACVVQPAPGVAAGRKNAPGLNIVMAVEDVVGIFCRARTQRRIQA